MRSLASPYLVDLLSRREVFSRSAAGFFGLALGSLLSDEQARASSSASPRGPHFTPKARAVIQLFQHGGPSHVDLLDPKPELTRRHNQPMPGWFTDRVLLTQHGNLMASPFRFRPAG